MLEETVCDGVVGLLRRTGRQLFEGADVFATLGALYIYIEYGIVHLTHDTLATCKHRGVVVEEGQPKVDIVPTGRLIADVTHERTTILTLIAYQMAKDILLGDADTAMGLADGNKQLVEGIVIEWVVDQPHDGIGIVWKGQTDG